MRIRSLSLVLLLAASAASAVPRWHWEDDFSRREQARLVAWIEHADRGIEALFGDLPFAYDVHFHRLDNRGEPVPWANTSKRYNGRAVNFHVDVRHSQEDFIADWTASHEISHLLFPYVGRDGMWFAEGIASYIQYQAMYANGVLSWEQAIRRYADRFDRAERTSRVGNTPVAEMPRNIRQSRAYVRMYWGGAAYFLEVDRRLAETRGIRLNDVIRDYVECCFGRSSDHMGLMATFDRLSKSTIFTDSYGATVERRGFPDVDENLTWLRRNPPELMNDPAGIAETSGTRRTRKTD